MTLKIAALISAATVSLLGCHTVAAHDNAEAMTARHFDHIRAEPKSLELFLREMPKGGDLHNHLSGAIYAESYIKWAAADGFCLHEANFSLVRSCPQGDVLAARLTSDTALYGKTIDALSMKDFIAGAESGHDHFFNTFAKFSAVGKLHDGDMLAEAVSRAAADHVAYVELMHSPGMDEARALAASFKGQTDLDRLATELMPKMPALVIQVRRQLDDTEAIAHKAQGCGTAAASAACNVVVRYIAQVIRTFPPDQVFAQSLLGFVLANADPRVVGVNLVAPEDDPITLRDYDMQMRQLQFLVNRYPNVSLSLHAGELSPGLVGPQDLSFHIAEAVRVAKARRIGHGVDIIHENNAPALMEEMAQRHVLVEINLTSNDVILGIKGNNHPFPIYWKAGVPLALSTDDEGVSRINLTNEFERAVLTYGLSYLDLKKLVRNSLEYSFLQGESFWQSADYSKPASICASLVSEPCRGFLAKNDKARLQAALEDDLNRFERRNWMN